MSTPQLSPYLNFAGDCKAAMEFYHGIFGGKLEMSSFADSKAPCPDDWKEKIIHASLINDTMSFMASDAMPHGTVIFGDSVHLSIAGTDAATITAYFEKLSVGGTVIMPLAKQFWGDTFGMLTDKFGIHWMVNISAK